MPSFSGLRVSKSLRKTPLQCSRASSLKWSVHSWINQRGEAGRPKLLMVSTWRRSTHSKPRASTALQMKHPPALVAAQPLACSNASRRRVSSR